jgi:hypothetical protein
MLLTREQDTLTEILHTQLKLFTLQTLVVVLRLISKRDLLIDEKKKKSSKGKSSQFEKKKLLIHRLVNRE